MKKLIFWTKRALVMALSLLAITTTSFAANDGDPEMLAILRTAVDEMNDECPQEINDDLILNKVYLSNNRMVYDFLTDDETLGGLILLKELSSEEFESLMMKGMTEGNDEVLLFMAVCVEADYGLEFKFSNLGRTNSLSIIMTQYDLMNELENYDLDEILTEYILEYM